MKVKNYFKSLVLIAVVGIGSSFLFNSYAGGAERVSPKKEQEILSKEAMPKLLRDSNNVNVAEFYVRDENGNERRVYGKIISEDEKKIIIEEPQEHTVTANYYLQRRIERLHKFVVPEIKFYEELGEKYYAQTGDFNRDSDDWAQAFRYFTRSKQISIKELGEDNEKAREIDKKLAEMEEEREIWETEIQRRAKSKVFEFQSRFGIRTRGFLEEIGDYEDSLSRLKKGRKNLEESFANMSRGKSSFSSDLLYLDKSIKSSSKKFEDLWLNISKARIGMGLSDEEKKLADKFERVIRLYLPFLNECDQIKDELSLKLNNLNDSYNEMTRGIFLYDRTINNMKEETESLTTKLKKLWLKVSDELSKIEYETETPVEKGTPVEKEAPVEKGKEK